MSDNCVICGDYVPEGTQVCKSCQDKPIQMDELVRRLRVCAYGDSEDCDACVYHGEPYCASKLAQDALRLIELSGGDKL